MYIRVYVYITAMAIARAMKNWSIYLRVNTAGENGKKVTNRDNRFPLRLTRPLSAYWQFNKVQ